MLSHGGTFLMKSWRQKHQCEFNENHGAKSVIAALRGHLILISLRARRGNFILIVIASATWQSLKLENFLS